MSVRSKETKANGLDINIEDFVYDCLLFKLPQLLPKMTRTNHLKLAIIVHDSLLKDGDDASMRQAIAKEKLKVNDSVMKKLPICGMNIMHAVQGLGIDMVEEDAPKMVHWSV